MRFATWPRCLAPGLLLAWATLALAGCASNGAWVVERHRDTDPEPGHFTVCHGYGCTIKTAVALTEEQWQRVIAVNLSGVFFTLQAAARRLVEQGRGGRLIAITSIMALWGSQNSAAYCASKAGVESLVKSFAQDLGRHGITCNGIGPGFVHTAMTESLRENPEFEARLVDQTPAGRIGEPEDIASVAAWLARDEAGFMSGTTVFPDGGITAGGSYSRALILEREQSS